ncbi:MAG: hypothetical protein A2600_03795 [Candidatus Lambdaproteobacteria bacterium RIFOXYD1_FULL_56_27]|uniref:Tyr recombinase domain-containing protein n=1 Tax=Candidatus Lambdaproteobacteria bacterium RIFOXYD2_FULL_56_26 TaxID=1817773 RepID=A0A1F6H3K2_9PROT|nr:MAG: hypothetical protein A2426_11205 [Candidatus Lambdaproteobacteria bacterium RIFOXYC1_FULL_56_13]OGH04884.1 MAG: hypothetical protein A2557_07860 [Candidatus Lambdaproteobacteria bacterium RIFOXYD2_FULL_56_26]OGH09349.1 MAG: hypothetical protein A2600_03795 [Candidatus Lambdaproteobacteria bacterium RIFOXYD1_FULL_56_27]
MDLTPKIPSPNRGFLSKSYQAAQEYKRDRLWQELSKMTVAQAAEAWLLGLGTYTKRNYLCGFRALAALGILDPELTLQEFSLVNHESRVDQIKLLPNWAESTKQARAAAYIGFTAFLQRRTQGLIVKALSNREGASKTFFKVREKVKTNPLSEVQTKQFLTALGQLNPRDQLVAKLILQGGKRKGEVLGLKIEQINFESRVIRFRQSKTKGVEKETWITYPQSVLNELLAYLNGRTKGVCFVTRNGLPLAANQLDRNFLKAGALAGVPFPVTPHVLRVTLVTRLKELKVQDSDIIKITGHASPVQLLAYDRTDPADNASTRFSLV